MKNTGSLIQRIALLLALLAAFPGTPARAGAPTPVYLPLVSKPEVSIAIAGLLKPFNADTQDLLGPGDWYVNYGKTPEIIVSSNGGSLDVLAQDYDNVSAWTGVLLHIAPGSSGGCVVTQALTGLPMLNRVMGLAADASGNRYYATAIDESAQVSSSYPPSDTYRTNIVRVVKVDAAGQVLFNIDLDIARHDFNANAEMIINPMTFGSARLAVGGNEIALVHSINTAPDWNINGARHQKALSTRLNAATGAITRVSDIWVSHSFDQRLLYDGAAIVENHLGDAYPRTIAFGRSQASYPLFYIKGALGENLTATRLGNLALIQNDPTFGYLALFVSESTATTGTMYGERINGPRNLAMVRINRSSFTLDPALPDTLAVTSSGTARSNPLRWLSAYSAASNLHAERPKLVALGGDEYIVLWEQWTHSGGDTFNGVYALRIDAQGSVLAGPSLVTSHHLPRGDDAFLFNGTAAWITGSDTARSLSIHRIAPDLTYTSCTLQ